jgi:hypothetical protein
MFGSDAIPIIGDVHTSYLPLRPQPQVRPAVGVVQSVGQQVLHHLNRAIPIRQQNRHLRWGGEVQCEATFLCQRFK